MRTTTCPARCSRDAAHTYVARYGVKPGTRAVVFANHDGAYADALALRAGGVDIAAIVDARGSAAQGGADVTRAREAGLAILADAVVARAHGRRHVAAVDVVTKGGGASRRIDCDLVCVSGGCNPAVHLFSQARGKLRYDDALAAFVPDTSPLPIVPAGAANGRFGLARRWPMAHAAAGVAAAARRRARAGRPRRRAATEPAVASAPAAAVVGSALRRPVTSASSTCRTTSPPTTSRSPRAKATRRSST